MVASQASSGGVRIDVGALEGHFGPITPGEASGIGRVLSGDTPKAQMTLKQPVVAVGPASGAASGDVPLYRPAKAAADAYQPPAITLTEKVGSARAQQSTLTVIPTVLPTALPGVHFIPKADAGAGAGAAAGARGPLVKQQSVFIPRVIGPDGKERDGEPIVMGASAAASPEKKAAAAPGSIAEGGEGDGEGEDAEPVFTPVVRPLYSALDDEHDEKLFAAAEFKDEMNREPGRRAAVDATLLLPFPLLACGVASSSIRACLRFISACELTLRVALAQCRL